MTDETEPTIEPPAHVPGQINLEGEVEEAPPKPADPRGPRDLYTNTEADAAEFERRTA